MLDTLILQIEKDKYHITDYNFFNTTKEQMINSYSPYKKWINNSTASDKNNKIYKPRLTIIKRGQRFILKIEFSAPKLLFDNNIDELDNVNFDATVKNLQQKMKAMGVLVWTKHIEEAEVISFHPSKNIPLTNGITANLIIKELKKVDISKRFDIDEKNYRNNGEVLQYYTRSHSFVIYDKMNDLIKPQRRATDKDQTKNQLSIFNSIKEKDKRFELLRIEIRLSLKRKMNEILGKVGHTTNPVFKDVFQKDLCQKIVNLYWNNFFSDNLFLFTTNNNPQEILRTILSRYPKIKSGKAIEATGTYLLSRDDEGIRGFRQIIDNYRPKTNWQFVKRNLKLFEDGAFTGNIWSFLSYVRQELKEFRPYRIKGEEYLNISQNKP
jgi:hypothetical protein